MSLNKAQKEAVSHKEGPCLVLAGPGSGKTLTIAKRIEYLIKVYKVRPEEILSLPLRNMRQEKCEIVFNMSWKGEGFPSHLEHFMAFFTEF